VVGGKGGRGYSQVFSTESCFIVLGSCEKISLMSTKLIFV
jgi:hypothetical protein